MEIVRTKSCFLDSNTYVVKKDGNCIIIDCGLRMERLLPLVENLNVQAILLTHGHFDHSFHLDHYVRIFKCPVIASKNTQETLLNPELSYTETVFNNFENFIFFQKERTIKIGDWEIKCIPTKGHSACSSCYMIEKSLFTGDTVFFRGIGRTNLNGGNPKQMIESLKKIYKLDFDRIHSGHYHSSTHDQQMKNIERFIKRTSSNKK